MVGADTDDANERSQHSTLVADYWEVPHQRSKVLARRVRPICLLIDDSASIWRSVTRSGRTVVDFVSVEYGWGRY